MKRKIALLLRVIAAGILLQTLYFKFSGAPESKFIFSTLGVEPFGRWFAGMSELVAATLLLVPATQVLGALMGIGIMLGALLSHLAILGIEVQGDGGLLFGLACAVLVSCVSIVVIRRDLLNDLIQKILSFLPAKSV